MPLRVVPDHTVSFMDAPLPPGESALVTARPYDLPGRQYRVTNVRVVADYPKPWLGRLVRRIPGVRSLFAGRDARDRERATAQMKIDQVGVENHRCRPEEVDQLPVAVAGHELSVVVINDGDRPLVARVSVEGILS
jgi:hypothetical protein